MGKDERVFQLKEIIINLKKRFFKCPERHAHFFISWREGIKIFLEEFSNF